MKALQDAMEAVRRQVVSDEGNLLDAIQHLPADRVLEMIPTTPWFEAQGSIERELYRDVLDGGSRVKLPSIQKQAIEFAFDRSRPEAAAWARKESAALVTNITEDQRAVIRSVVGNSLEEGVAPREVARNLRNVIGLTEQQQGWVARHYDRQLSQGFANGLTPARAQELAQRSTDRYHSKIFRYRTETIARTEILNASHEGRREAWRQGIEQGYIPPTTNQQWSAEADSRSCEECIALNEMIVPLGTEFPAGDPPIHPNCRCDVVLTDAPPTDLTNLTDAQLDEHLESLMSGGPQAEGLSVEDEIAKLTAQRDPIVGRLLDSDYGRVPLSPDEYADLVAQQKPLLDRLRTLQEQQLAAKKKPTRAAPTQRGQASYDALNDAVDYGDEARVALQEWQGEGYRRVQGELYGRTSIRGVDPEVRVVMDGLDSAMDSIPSDTILYRGQTAGLDNLQVGSTVKSNSYVSTSTDPVTAGAFSKSRGQVTGALVEGDTATILRITPKRARGAVMPDSDEFEVLLARNTEMKVTNVSEEVINNVKFRIVDVEA